MPRITSAYREEIARVLDPCQAHEVFMNVLDKLRQDHFIGSDKRLWRSCEMQGSDVNEPVPSGVYPRRQYEILVQACCLYDDLKSLCFNFEPHRVSKGKCVDCQKEVK